jgi:glucokinase
VSARATFGVDLGGTNLRVAVVDPDATIVGQHTLSTPGTLDEIVATIASGVGALRALRPDASVLGVGAAGMVDREGTIHYSPNVPAFLHAPVRARLETALAMPVVVDNDANAAVLGELTHGVARGHDDVLLVTLGTGVGGGVVTGGVVLRGAHGFGAEIGHFQVDPDGPMCACGQRGHWEAMASGTALGALGRARVREGRAPGLLARAGGDVDAVHGTTVGGAAQDGDADALAVLHAYAGNVAVGLVGLVNVLDPELVVVSGGLIDLGDLLLDPVRAAFTGRIEGASQRPDVPIVAAALGDDAGLVGAAVLGRDAR